MKSKMSYKAKRNIIILAIIVALLALASVGTYLFVSGNDETQALSQMNATGETRSGEEVEQSQNGDNLAQGNNDENGEEATNNEEAATEPNEEGEDNEGTEPNNNRDNNVASSNSSSSTANNNSTNNSANNTNNNNTQTQTQTVTTTERVESTETLVGYETSGLQVQVPGLNADMANLEATIEAVSETNNVLVSPGKTITYNITINGDKAVEGINVAAALPEGTEFVEASDEGTLNDGVISWKVNVDGEKVVSFIVTVEKTEGDITASAVVNGKTTNTVTNTVDAVAPVIEIRSEVKEVNGVKYVNAEDPQLKITDENAFSTVVLNSKGEEVATAESEEPNAEFNFDTYYDTFGIGWLGEDTFTIVATDVAGNVAKETFTVDRTAPELDIENINEAGYVNTQGARNVNVKDANSFTTVIFDVNGKVVNTREAKQAEDGTYYDRFNIEWLGEGKFTIKVTDVAGNVTEKTVTVDATAPELEIENLSDTGYVNTKGARNINVKDANPFTTVVLNETGEVVNTREAKQAEDGTYYDRFNIEWLGEGTFTVIATDAAGNVTEETFTVDVTAPELEVENLSDTGYVNTKGARNINVKDANPFTTVVLNAEGEEVNRREAKQAEDGTYYDRFNIEWLGEGTFTVIATDAAGNATEKTFTVDVTAPVRKSADYYVTGKTSIVQGDKDDEIGYQFFYAKNGDKIVLNAKFHEELAKVPTFVLIDSNGAEYVLEAEYVGLDDKGGYTYTTSYNIAEDEANMPEGEIRFRISDIVDKAGNVGDNIEKASNGRRIVYDRTAPTLTVKDGKDNKDREYTIGNEPDFSRISFALADNILLKEYVINGEVCGVTPNKWSDANYFGNLEKVLVEGKNTIIVRDMAGNESAPYEFNYDTVAPEYKTLRLHNDTHYNNGGDLTVATNGDYIRFGVHFAEKLAVEPTIKLAGDGEELTFTMTFREDSSSDTEFVYMADVQLTEEMKLPQGEINFEVSGYADAAGNVGETLTFEDVNHKKYNKVIYDTIAPVVGADTGYPLYILNLSDENHRQYIKNGQTLKVEANFNEMLDGVPTLIIGNDENTQTAELEYKWKNGDWYVYVATIEIDNSILKLNEHEIIPFKIEGAKDAAGNIVELDNDDVTYTKQYGQVKYDNDAPVLGEGHPLYILNRDDANRRKYIRDGEMLRVEANFNEELAEEPILTIGSGENTQVAELRSKGYSEKSGNYVYVWDIKIDNDVLKLKDNTNIPFTITNVVDLAGNETSFDNDNVSYTDVYGQVEYDNTAPEYQTLGILNTTHMNEGDDVNYVRDGDNVRILVWFKEKLAVEPMIEIKTNDGYIKLEGDNALKYSNDGRENVHYYVANFTATPEMNLPQGQIGFRIYGYADAAGNVGAKLTEKDINRKDYAQAIYDTVAPARVYSTVRLSQDKEDNPYIGEDKNKYYYLKNGEEFEFAMSFTEELKQAPTVTIAGRNVEMTLNEKVKKEESKYLYEGTFTIPAEETELTEGTLEIKVSNIVDFAGNVMEDTIQTPTSNGRIVVYDRTAPVFTNVENGTTYGREVTPRIEETNLDKAVITRPNGVTEAYKVDADGKGEAVSANGEYTITVTDRAGNSETVKFTIDTKAPVPTFDYSNRSKDGTFFTTQEDITVTLTVNEELKATPDGWEKTGDRTYTRVHDANGTYTVVLEDLLGNTTEVEYTVQKIDRKGPVIDIGATVVWYYATEDGEKTSKEVTEFSNGELWNTGLTDIPLGKYYIEYYISDNAGNRGVTHKILNLVDTTAPEIIVPEKITMESGVDVLDLKEYYANGKVEDNYYSNMSFSNVNTVMYYMEDGKKTDKMVQEFVDGELWGTKLTNIPLGDYYVSYNITDKSGNKGTAHTILTVQDTKAPEITLNGETKQTIVIGSGEEYKELGATAKDLRDGEIKVTSDNIRIDWIGDDGNNKWSVKQEEMTYDKPGHYNVIYKVSDENNNTKEVTRYVYVVEPTE